MFQILFWCAYGIRGQGTCILQETESEEGWHGLLFSYMMSAQVALSGHRVHLNFSVMCITLTAITPSVETVTYRDTSLSSQK